jgi:hypothetical protein
MAFDEGQVNSTSVPLLDADENLTQPDEALLAPRG